MHCDVARGAFVAPSLVYFPFLPFARPFEISNTLAGGVPAVVS
jgi:hypothetical protein